MATTPRFIASPDFFQSRKKELKKCIWLLRKVCINYIFHLWICFKFTCVEKIKKINKDNVKAAKNCALLCVKKGIKFI